MDGLLIPVNDSSIGDPHDRIIMCESERPEAGWSMT
jgi:hypothetical protein